MKINKILAALAATVVLFTACNDDEFLVEKSYSNDSAGFYQSEQAMEIGLASCYSEVQYLMLGNLRQNHSWMLLGIGLDTFSANSATDQLANWAAMTPESGYARHWPDYVYKLANRANTVIDMIDENESINYTTATKKNELRAEAVFMRAWAYRVLAGMYGGVMYAEHMTREARYDYELLTREETWAKIAEDFKWAEENLPTTPRLMGTVTKAAAAHYLAETYLALGQFKEAEDAATRVINGTDGSYSIMTTRFGNRADQAKDRYGNDLNPYWDLFRCSAKTDGSVATDSNPNDPGNKEAIWVCQYDFSPSTDNYPLGGSGDSWWRCHAAPVEGAWAPWIPMGGKNGQRVGSDGNKYYVFTADATCYPEGVKVKNAGTPPKDIPEAQGRGLAYSLSMNTDSLACRARGVNNGHFGLVVLANEYMTRKAGDPLGSVWDDPNDSSATTTLLPERSGPRSRKRFRPVLMPVCTLSQHPTHSTSLLVSGNSPTTNTLGLTSLVTMCTTATST